MCMMWTQFVAAFASDFYIDAETARTAVQSERMFNLMHLESGVKVDFIDFANPSEFRQVEFARRRKAGLDCRYPDMDRES